MMKGWVAEVKSEGKQRVASRQALSSGSIHPTGCSGCSGEGDEF